MNSKVAVIGIGYAGFDTMTPGLSTKELMFEAAVRAYEDAGVDPRRDVESFICCTEDFWEGNTISDEYMPDQIGAAQRPLCTVPSDGICGLATAYMQISTGFCEIATVESHSKLSDVLSKGLIGAFSLDPVFVRPLNVNPNCIAGLAMNRYLHESGSSVEQCASVVVKNKGNALKNPRGVFGGRFSVEDVLDSEELAYPLKKMDTSQPIDGAVVVVLASRERARRLVEQPVWIEGVGWSSGTPWLESGDIGRSVYAELASSMAYKMAGIEEPRSEIDFFEVDDTYSFKELQHLEALRICRRAETGKLTEKGLTGRDGELPVNPSGGSLGVGDMVEAKGLHRILEAVLQLRGEAGGLQVKDVKRSLVQSWRGIPTASGAVVILSKEE